VVFSTLGADDSYDPSFAYITGVSHGFSAEIGFRFLPTASGELTQFRSALFLTGQARPVEISVYRDDGTVPGMLLGSWEGTPPSVGIPPPIGTQPWALALGGVFVDAGQAYFLTVQRAALSVSWNWHAALPRAYGFHIYRDPPMAPNWTSGPGEMPAFELSIPSPGPVGFAGVGGVLVLIRRRGR